MMWSCGGGKVMVMELSSDHSATTKTRLPSVHQVVASVLKFGSTSNVAMAPAAPAQLLLSPAELSYLHDSLSLTPPIRPDGRTPTQFRPLIAETDILPTTNGSARVCFADGTEAIVGVKAQVEKSQWRPVAGEHGQDLAAAAVEADDQDDEGEQPKGGTQAVGENSWVEMSIELPGYRDDDALPTFLSAMLTEALLASGELKGRLWINRRFHWKLYIDVRGT
jgi:exosome complex component RRP42